MAGLRFQPPFEQEGGQGERRGGHPGPSGGERSPAHPDSTFANSDAATPGMTPSHPSHVWPGRLEQDHRTDDDRPSTPNGISLATMTG